jgi:hypothetical protein
LALGAGALVVALMLAGIAVLGADPAPRPRVASEMPATAMHRTVEPANNSPLLVADPGEPRFVALANRLDAPDFSCALQLSGDGGRGWVPARPVPKLPRGAEKCYAPEVAFDRSGTLYYLFVGLRGRGNTPMGVFLTTSEDRGRSFTPPRRVLGPFSYSVRMAIDPDVGRGGRIHLVWLKATSPPATGGFGPPPNPILATHSDDGGRSFSKPVQVSDPERERVVAPSLSLGPDRNVHVAYYDLRDDARDYQGLEGPVWKEPWSLVVAHSADGGRSFGAVAAERSIVPPERVMLIFTMAPPALAVQGERVCVAWTDAREGDRDVLARCSETQGQSWDGKAQRLNDDPVGNGISQYLPGLSIAPDGRLDAVFYDRRVDRGNIGTDISYTFSLDGGRNFKPNLRLSGDPFDSRIGQRYPLVSAKGQVEFGSRLGLLSRDDGAVAAWADTRNSLQDIFTRTVDFDRPTDPSVPLALAALALGAIGLLALGAEARRRRRRARVTAAP